MFSKSVATFLLFIRFFSGVLCNCDSYFQTQPKDVVVKEGEDAFFICKVSNVNLMTDSLTWELNPNKYRILVSQTPIRLINEITSVLTVLNVGREEQTQRCVLNYMDDNFMMRSCESRVARIAVQYFPREDEIECGPKIAQAIHENDISSVWCNVPRGNPVVNLSWNVDDDDNVNVLSRRDEILKNILTSELDYNVTRFLHSRVIECLVTTKHPFPNETISCTIGPFMVLYKPHLHVNPSYMSLQPNNTDDLKINCSGDGNPNVLEVSWTCIPPSESCRNETGRILTIAINEFTSQRSAKILATCSASNKIGESNATSVISIQGSYTEIKAKPLDCRNISLQASDVATDVANVTVMCRVHCFGSSGDETVRVTWHFNGRIVKEDGGSPDQYGETEFYFTFNFSSTDQRNTVICDTSVHQNSSFARQNVSIEVQNPKKNLDISNGSWSTKRSKDSPTTSRVMAPFGKTTDNVSIKDNITIEHPGEKNILYTTLGIAITAFFVVFMLSIGLIVIYKIIQAKVRLSMNEMMKVPSNLESINDQCQSVGPCENMMNDDSDYEEPLPRIARYFHHFQEQGDVSLYEMSMLKDRSSMHSQDTNDTSGSNSLRCYSMSDEQGSCSSCTASTCQGKQASENSFQSELDYEMSKYQSYLNLEI